VGNALALSIMSTAMSAATAGLAMLLVIGRHSISEMISAGRQIVLGQPA
jgi:hypothetical protein